MGDRLQEFVEPYEWCFKTKTRDTSEYAVQYVSGQLRVPTKRTIAEISRIMDVPKQNMHHFISNSPWSGEAVIDQVQYEMRSHPEYQTGAVLVLDESADEKAGEMSAGAGRQHNGRLGKIDMSQVGVFLTLATPRVNSWVSGELFIPEKWFEDEAKEKRKKVGIPETRTFLSKPEIGWQLIQRAQANQLPFDAVAMDDLYGRNNRLRQRLDKAHIEYYGDVPCNTKVYLDKPKIVYRKGKRKQKLKQYDVVAKHCVEVQELLHHADVQWKRLTLRPNERGTLTADFGRIRVWTRNGTKVRPEWVLFRKNRRDTTYVLSNANVDLPLETMAQRKTMRYFIERSNQDSKGELGWDEFQATKFRAWHHQLALTILSSWFIAETRLDWMERFQTDPALLVQYETDILPMLSVANVRELLRAAIPLPRPSIEEATALVMEHLVNRTRSRRSRMKQTEPLPPDFSSGEM